MEDLVARTRDDVVHANFEKAISLLESRFQVFAVDLRGQGRSTRTPGRYLALPDALQALARFFYDTALSVMPQQIAALRALVPISQIVYGTDYPFANEDRVRMAESFFAALPFTPEERAMVRHANAWRLFKGFAARA